MYITETSVRVKFAAQNSLKSLPVIRQFKFLVLSKLKIFADDNHCGLYDVLFQGRNHCG